MAVERVVKSIEWAKSVCGLTDKEIKRYHKEGFPVLYIYDTFRNGKDGVSITCFQTVLPDSFIQKRFSRCAAAGSVCEVDLRAAQ